MKKIFIMLFTLFSCIKESPTKQTYKIVPIPKGKEGIPQFINTLLEKDGDELEESILAFLNSVDSDIDRRSFMLNLLDESFKKGKNIDEEALLASSGITKSFQHNGKELNFGAHVLASIISQKEDIREYMIYLWTNIEKKVKEEKNKDKKRKYFALKISLQLYLNNTTERMDYDEQLYVLIVRYRPYSNPDMYEIFLSNMLGWSAIVQDEVNIKVFGRDFESYKSITELVFTTIQNGKMSKKDVDIYIARRILTAFTNNLEFKYEYFKWLVEEKGISYHKDLIAGEDFSKERLIHSSARYFHAEWFLFLLEQGHKVDFCEIGTAELDPIHILITEAARLDKEDEAIEFLESIKDIVDLKSLTKERGYLHFSSYFFLEKLTNFFLKYEDIDSEYEYKDEKYNVIEFIMSQDLFKDFPKSKGPYTAVAFINNLVNDRKNNVPSQFSTFMDFLLKKGMKVTINQKESTDLSTLFNLSIPKGEHGYKTIFIDFTFGMTKDMATKLVRCLDKILLNIEDRESAKNLYLSIEKSKLFSGGSKLIIKGHIAKQILLQKEDIRDDFFNWLKDNERYYLSLPAEVLSNDIELNGKYTIQEYYSLLHMAARQFNSGLFIKLMDDYGYELNYSVGLTKVDPIHLMMIQSKIIDRESDALEFLESIKDKLNFNHLTKERGYLHYASAINSPKLVKFFLNYAKVNSYYDTSFANTTVNEYDERLVPKSIKEKLDNFSEKERAFFEFTGSTPITMAFFTREFLSLLGFKRSKDVESNLLSFGSICDNLIRRLNDDNQIPNLRKTVRLLVSRGADINLPTKNGTYPFEGMMKSAPGRSEEALEVMVEETRVTINMPSKKGKSKKTFVNLLLVYLDEANKRNLSEEEINKSLRKRVNAISGLMTEHILRTDRAVFGDSISLQSLAHIYKGIFEIDGNSKEDFIKLITKFNEYPNFVKLVVKYPESFGFDYYNEDDYLGEMEKNHISQELIDFAREQGYLSKVEMEEIESLYKARKQYQKIEKAKHKSKKRAKAKKDADQQKLQLSEVKVEVEGYNFQEVLRKSDEEIEGEILHFLDEDKTKSKQILTLLGEKKLPSLLEKSIDKDELFSNLLINKGYNCSVDTFVEAVKLGKYRFVKKVLEEQNINLEGIENLSEIEIDKDMVKSLKNIAHHFNMNSDVSSESEEEIVAKGGDEIALFNKVYLHGKIKREDRDSFIDYLKEDANREKLLQDIEKIRANQKGDWSKFIKNDFWRIRDKYVRIYYFIKNKQMTIIGFNKYKNVQSESKKYINFMQNLTKEEGIHEDLDDLLVG